MAQSLKSVQKIFHTGLIADAVQSLGTSTIVNVVDKKALQGKLTSAGVAIGQTINGKALTLNATDAIVLMATVGAPGNWLKKNGLMKAGITLAVKKVAEAFDYIDPPTPMDAANPNATNVTFGRIARMQGFSEQVRFAYR